MAELRSTDIIGKLRKINQQIKNTNARIDSLDGTTETINTNNIVVSYVTDLLTNITGYYPLNFTLSEKQPGSVLNVTSGDFYEVLYQEQSATKAQASNFLKGLIGSTYVPTRSSVLPQYHYVITLSGKVYFICGSITGGLRFYEVPIDLGVKISNDINTDANQTDKVPSVKAVKEYVDNTTANINVPTKTSDLINDSDFINNNSKKLIKEVTTIETPTKDSNYMIFQEGKALVRSVVLGDGVSINLPVGVTFAEYPYYHIIKTSSGYRVIWSKNPNLSSTYGGGYSDYSVYIRISTSADTYYSTDVYSTVNEAIIALKATDTSYTKAAGYFSVADNYTGTRGNKYVSGYNPVIRSNYYTSFTYYSSVNCRVNGTTASQATTTNITPVDGIINDGTIFNEFKELSTKEYVEQKSSDLADSIQAHNLATDSHDDIRMEIAALEQTVSSHLTYVVVSELPSTGQEKTIYLVGPNNGDGNAYDYYSEYIWVPVQGQIEARFELLGDTRIDLSEYAKKTDISNATLTIQKNGSDVATFTANASSNATANINVPTKTSDLINDSDYTTQTGVTDQGYSKLIIGTTSGTAAEGNHTHSNILTTAPTSENTSGEMRFVVLSIEPNTRYSGYLYIITG